MKGLGKMLLIILAAVVMLAMLAGCGGEKVEVKLLPQDANLEKASDVVIEPKKAPYNLGGWLENNEVSWKVDIPRSGMYQILIEYSRPGNEPKASGLLVLSSPGKEVQRLKFSAHPTGKDSGDWSVYTINDNCGSNLEKGPLTLSIRPSFATDYIGTEYFMNLRSVTLRLEEK
ncbi:hypothetical protein SDC9_03952 [bioreactor metagenome]|uniref:CBM6 domain-containing protein n=1 Tax=bioreactor metagenome TaxID=1076179 RepID=A0A644SUQ8_9ZZZZ|nr:hypothetical protein [Negativicutes bacterium]